jgi:tRNA-splicing ligase RtcB
MEPVREQIVREGPWKLRIPRHGGMRVDAVVYASAEMIEALPPQDQSLRQVCNVAHLPGIVSPSIAMPDFHWGYGFPIGGVAAFDPSNGGVVSPGGVGYDINCGVRLLATTLPAAAARPKLRALAEQLYRTIPSGVGAHQPAKLALTDLDRVLEHGARWAADNGFGSTGDIERIEEGGCLTGADAGQVSPRAKERGRGQLGTIGSGNHFVEVGVVDTIYDVDAARAFGLESGSLTILVHTGSRGLGYQVCDDSLAVMMSAAARHGIALPDPQLQCAPLGSAEADHYLAAMRAAANFAFANRQVITHYVREALEHTLSVSPREHGMRLLYDVCHNVAKMERHAGRDLCVHRKGATRALPPGDTRLPPEYRKTGQPVLVPGDMGRYSFVLAGEAGSAESFASSCHGAGRVLSRKAAMKQARPRNILQELAGRGIEVRAASRATVDEEMPDAYKDVADVVEVVAAAGLARKVARLVPLAVIKG